MPNIVNGVFLRANETASYAGYALYEGFYSMQSGLRNMEHGELVNAPYQDIAQKLSYLDTFNDFSFNWQQKLKLRPN